MASHISAEDRRTALRVLARHAKASGIDLSAALSKRIKRASQARRGAWQELFRDGWSRCRIARVFGVDHSSVCLAIQVCPVCGESFERAVAAPFVMTCGVATQVAYHHVGRMCVRQVSFALAGEAA